MQTSPTAIPIFSGQNFAPVGPLLQLRTDPKRPNKFKDALKEIKNHYERVDKAAWEEVYRAGQLVDLFIQGKQIVRQNPYNGVYIPRVATADDELAQRCMNIMQFYETCSVEKDLSSNPDILIEAAKYSEQAKAAAHGASTIWKHYADKFLTADFCQIDAKLALRFGTAINRLKYDPGAEGIIVYQELAQQKTISLGGGHGSCGVCETFGSAADFMPPTDDVMGPQDPACPKCGSNLVSVIPPAAGPLSSVADVQPVKLGDFMLESLPLPGCKWDMGYRPEFSSWFMYKQAVAMTAIKSIIGPIAAEGGQDLDDIGLRVLQNLGLAGQAVFGRSSWWSAKGTQDTSKGVVTELYLSPEDYGDINITPEETLGGGILQPGEMRKTFPGGAVTVWLNDDILLGVYEASHKKELISRPWFLRPMTGVGRGAQDMVEIQKRLNVLDSQQVAYWSSVATPAIIYDQDLIQGDEVGYIGHPKMSLPADTSRMAGDNRTIASALWQMTPAPIPGAFVDYTERHLNNAMQLASHVTSFSGGLPGVNNNTATGAQITQSNSDAVWTPTLQMKGVARQRLAWLLIPAYRERFPMERQFSLGGDFSRAQMIAVKGADLDVELRFVVQKNSEEARSPYTRRANLAAVFQLAQGAAGLSQLKQIDPSLYSAMMQAFDVELEDQSENPMHVEQICTQRIEQLRQASAQGGFGEILMAQVQPDADPAQAAMMQQQLAQMQQQAVQSALRPPVSQYEGAQDKKAAYLQLWLDTDQGQMADPTLRAAVEQLLVLHFQNAGNQAQHVALAAGSVQAVGALPSQATALIGEHLAPEPTPKPGEATGKAPRPKPKKEGATS